MKIFENGASQRRKKTITKRHILLKRVIFIVVNMFKFFSMENFTLIAISINSLAAQEFFNMFALSLFIIDHHLNLTFF